MNELPEELVEAILLRVPEGRERALACWAVCTQWTRLLRDTSVFGWTCVECGQRKGDTKRTCEAGWFHVHARGGGHICSRCAFRLHRGRIIVDWRSYDIANVSTGPLRGTLRTIRTTAGTRLAPHRLNQDVLKYAIPGMPHREFLIRLPRCVINNTSYQPDDTQDRWDVGLMFLFNSCYDYDGYFPESNARWPKQTHHVLHGYGTEPCTVYLRPTPSGHYVVTSIARITKYRHS